MTGETRRISLPAHALDPRLIVQDRAVGFAEVCAP